MGVAMSKLLTDERINHNNLTAKSDKAIKELNDSFELVVNLATII